MFTFKNPSSKNNFLTYSAEPKFSFLFSYTGIIGIIYSTQPRSPLAGAELAATHNTLDVTPLQYNKQQTPNLNIQYDI